MTDLIDRQAAIEALHQWEQDYTWDDYDAKYSPSVVSPSDVIDGLPTIEIVRCRECKHHDGIRCFRWNSTIITGFDDFCSNGERRDENE